MNDWDYSEEEVREGVDLIEEWIESSGEIIDYVITDASESAPDRYSEATLDILFVTKKKLSVIVHDRETNVIYSTPVEKAHMVEIETTSQRIELTIRFPTGGLTVASYDESQFEEIRSLGLKVTNLIGE